MQKIGQARCTAWSEQEVGIQFQQVGDANQFYSLLDDFKMSITERHWSKHGWWILPKQKLQEFERFCQKHNLKISWTKRPNFEVSASSN